MKLSDYLQEDLVLSDLSARTKPEVLAELVAALKARIPDLEAERALAILMERERLGTTGIGDGIAIPHGKMEELDNILMVFGRSREGIEFESLDGKPCNLFFLVLAPTAAAGAHLRLLAYVSRLLKDEGFRARLTGGEGPALWETLQEA